MINYYDSYLLSERPNIQRIINNDGAFISYTASGAHFLPEIKQLIAALPENTHLRELKLNNMYLKDDEIDVFIDCLRRNTSLNSITYRPHLITQKGMEKLKEAVQLEGMPRFHIDCTYMDIQFLSKALDDQAAEINNLSLRRHDDFRPR